MPSNRFFGSVSSDFDFGATAGLGLREATVDDIGLDLSYDGDDSIEIEFPDNGAVSMEAAAPLREPTKDEVVLGVEDDILDLLSQDRREDILLLTGEKPDILGAVDGDVADEFSSAYTQAVIENPGLKWYARFINLVSVDKFRMDGDSLVLNIPRDVFKRAVVPFLSDFHADWADDSPLVKVVLDLADRYKSQDIEAKKATVTKDQKASRRNAAEDPGFDPSMVDFGDDEDTSLASDLDIDDDMFGDSEEVASMDISLSDLSNKAVADICDSEGLQGADVQARLLDEGFSKSRANEVAGIVSFLRQDRKRHLRPTGNYGGAVDFRAR